MVWPILDDDAPLTQLHTEARDDIHRALIRLGLKPMSRAEFDIEEVGARLRLTCEVDVEPYRVFTPEDGVA